MVEFVEEESCKGSLRCDPVRDEGAVKGLTLGNEAGVERFFHFACCAEPGAASQTDRWTQTHWGVIF